MILDLELSIRTLISLGEARSVLTEGIVIVPDPETTNSPRCKFQQRLRAKHLLRLHASSTKPSLPLNRDIIIGFLREQSALGTVPSGARTGFRQVPHLVEVQIEAFGHAELSAGVPNRSCGRAGRPRWQGVRC